MEPEFDTQGLTNSPKLIFGRLYRTPCPTTTTTSTHSPTHAHTHTRSCLQVIQTGDKRVRRVGLGQGLSHVLSGEDADAVGRGGAGAYVGAAEGKHSGRAEVQTRRLRPASAPAQPKRQTSRRKHESFASTLSNPSGELCRPQAASSASRAFESDSVSFVDQLGAMQALDRPLTADELNKVQTMSIDQLRPQSAARYLGTSGTSTSAKENKDNQTKAQDQAGREVESRPHSPKYSPKHSPKHSHHHHH